VTASPRADASAPTGSSPTIGAIAQAPPSASPSGNQGPSATSSTGATPHGTAAATATSRPAATRPPSPKPTVGPVSWQPALPLRAAFYYPWFPQAWKQSGMDPYTHYQPNLGYYDGASSSVLAKQLSAMRYAGIEVGIASWWGQGTLTDSRIPLLLRAAAGSHFRWTLYYEQEAYGDPSATQIAADLAYIGRHYASDPSYLRIGGRPVIFVYASGSDGCAMAQRWKQANASAGFYLVLKVFAGYRGCAAQPNGWHQYAPTSASDSQRGYSFSVSPGFWLATEAAPRLARDPTTFATAVRGMVASGAPFQLVTTFNEWGEGTAVESATQWTTASGYGTYLDILHANGR
jgi:Glycosyl hydrolase family 99